MAGTNKYKYLLKNTALATIGTSWCTQTPPSTIWPTSATDIPISRSITAARALSAWVRAIGKNRKPRAGWQRSSIKRASTLGWISGATMLPMIGLGGTSRWLTSCPSCWKSKRSPKFTYEENFHEKRSFHFPQLPH